MNKNMENVQTIVFGMRFFEISVFEKPGVDCIAGLEKLTNANQSVSAVYDGLFPVELTEIADWTSMSKYMLHSNFGQTLTRVIGVNFGAYTFILPLSLFP